MNKSIFSFFAVLCLFSCSRFFPDRPLVFSIIPEDNASGVQTDTAVTVIFSKPMNKKLCESSFTLGIKEGHSTGALSDGFFNWPGPDTMIFSPEQKLRSGTVYRIEITENAECNGGRNLSERFQSVFTPGAPVADGLAVVSVLPVNGQYNVGKRPQITVSVNRDVAKEDFIKAFSIIPSVSAQYNKSGLTFTILPAADLLQAALYTIKIKKELSDTAGYTLGDDFLSSFTTSSNFSELTLTGAVSSSGTIFNQISVTENINKDEKVVFHFSNPVSSEFFKRSFSFSDLVSGICDPQMGSNTAITFIPDRALISEKEYTLTINAGLPDVYGNTLSKTVSYRIRINGSNSIRPAVLAVRDSTGAILSQGQVISLQSGTRYTNMSVLFTRPMMEHRLIGELSVSSLYGTNISGTGIYIYSAALLQQSNLQLSFENISTGHTYELKLQGGDEKGAADIFTNTLKEVWSFIFKT